MAFCLDFDRYFGITGNIDPLDGWLLEYLPLPVEFLGWFLFYGFIFVVAKMFDDSDPQWGENPHYHRAHESQFLILSRLIDVKST